MGIVVIILALVAIGFVYVAYEKTEELERDLEEAVSKLERTVEKVTGRKL